MKSNQLTCFMVLAVFATLAAQQQQNEHLREHRRYRVIDTGTLGGPTSSLGFEGERDMNNRGTVVSTTETNLPDPFSPNCFLLDCFLSHTVVWQNGVLADFGALPGGNSDAGDVVGFAANQNEAFLAFFWKNGMMTNLGTVDDDPCSAARAINSKEQIVGASQKCDGTFVHAFLWERGTMLDLNRFVHSGSGVQLTAAVAINDRAEIAAQGVLSNGETHAFVLIPWDDDEGQAEGGEEANEGRAAAGENTAGPIARARATVIQANLTPSEMKDRVRALLINRDRRSRSFPPK
jgi:probable HAF family extracellular repeat protein